MSKPSPRSCHAESEEGKLRGSGLDVGTMEGGGMGGGHCQSSRNLLRISCFASWAAVLAWLVAVVVGVFLVVVRLLVLRAGGCAGEAGLDDAGNDGSRIPVARLWRC